jgi:hypothetical protein
MAAGEKEVTVEDDSVVTLELDPDTAKEVDAALPEEVDDSTVEVKPEKPEKPRIRQTKTELADATEALQQAVKSADDARRAAEQTALAERRRADEATRFAIAREEEARTFQTQVEDRELALINNGIESAKGALESATQEQQRAYESGEFAQATAAGARVAKAAAALDRYETAKVDYENRPKVNATVQTQSQIRQQVSPATSQLEQFLAGVAPRAQAWLRLHPECVPAHLGGDSVSHAKAMRGHNDAIARGVQEGSDDYFKLLEEHIGYRQGPPLQQQHTSSAASVTTAAQEGDNTRITKPPQQRQAIPSAPVSRDNVGASGQPVSRTVRLSPQQQEIALISYSQKEKEDDATYRRRAFQQYASELMKATAEGKIGRLTH